MRLTFLPLSALLLAPMVMTLATSQALAQRAPARPPAPAAQKAGDQKQAESKPADSKQADTKATDSKPGAPKSIGKFDDWQAATYQEAGQTVCYAFTRPASSQAQPAIAGRTEVVLTVTQRAGLRDAVALSAGFAYAANAEVPVQADQTTLQFYTSQRSAFARDGHAAIAAFQKSRAAVAKSPAPRGTVTDNFSLRGFSAAYAAINKACPAR